MLWLQTPNLLPSPGLNFGLALMAQNESSNLRPVWVGVQSFTNQMNCQSCEGVFCIKRLLLVSCIWGWWRQALSHGNAFRHPESLALDSSMFDPTSAPYQPCDFG